jgi:hypothetical protein
MPTFRRNILSPSSGLKGRCQPTNQPTIKLTKGGVLRKRKVIPFLRTKRIAGNGERSTAAVFLDIKKVSDIAWHPGLLYKLAKLHSSTSLVKLISSFLSNKKFKVSVEGEMSTPRVDY